MGKFLNNTYLNNRLIFLTHLKESPGQELPPDITVDDLIYDYTCVPQVATYYYDFKQNISSNEVVIPIYVTDWYQKEYYYNDSSETFTLRVDVDGEVRNIQDIPAGDYNLSLGVLSVGEHYFSIEITDKRGYRSQRLFNDIWIVDDSYNITSEQTYQITVNDLEHNGITLGLDENATTQQMYNNRVNMTNYLESLHQQGYRKGILPADSVIRVNADFLDADGNVTDTVKHITIPTNFTLDLNNSTIKLHMYNDTDYGEKGQITNLMVTFEDCIDSHLINGTLEGDYFERSVDKEAYINGANGEHSSCIAINGGKYNTVDNITITKITGYSLYCEKGSVGNHYFEDCSLIGDKWGDNSAGTWVDNIELIDGVEHEFIGTTDINKKYTSSFIDLTKIKSKLIQYNVEYIRVGKSLSDFPTGHYFEELLTFYDADKNYIDSFIVEESREVRIPSGSQYLRITRLGLSSDIDSFMISPGSYPRYSEWKNIEFIDNRTCCNPNRYKGLHIYNCNFTRTGQGITPLCIDAEDGGNTMQDLYVDHCSVVEQAEGQTGDFVAVAGSNVVFENNTNMLFGCRSQTRYVTVRNNKFREGSNSPNEFGTGWRTNHTFRCYDNDFADTRLFMSWHDNYTSQMKFKNCKNMNMPNAHSKPSKGHTIFESCIDIALTTGTRYDSCKFYSNRLNDGTGNSIFNNCEFLPEVGTTNTFELKSPNYGEQLQSIGEYNGCTFKTDINIYTRKEGAYTNGKFNNCIFEGTVKLKLLYINNLGDFTFSNCIFNKDITIDLTNTKLQFDNCTFNGTINYLNEGMANTEINN